MSERRTNQERSQASRRAIVSAARQLFGRYGYDATSLTDIATAASLTTGALYHHWSGKRDVFRAVVDDVHRELAVRVARVSRPGQPPRAQLLAASRVYLRLCAEPEVAQILLVDGPAVLGAPQWRVLDHRWWLAPTQALLEQAAAEDDLVEGHLVEDDLRLLAVALLGAITALGHAVASDRTGLRRSESVLSALLDGITAR
jgi:AcrR family transcriptional regulator